MLNQIIRKAIFWLATAILLSFLVKDAFSNISGSWLAGTLLLLPTGTLLFGIKWSLKFNSFKRIVRLLLSGILSLNLAYLVIAFVYWYFLNFNPNFFEKSIINPILLWVIMGFFVGLHFFLFHRSQQQEDVEEKTISFYSERKITSVPIKDILMIESLSDHTTVRLSNGQTLKNSIKISEWENKLPKFLRIHRSFLINPTFAIYKGNEIEMDGKQLVPISRKFKEITRRHFLES
ncbi:LytTR family DNA-binding domain-containing protein [Algoriphagus halophytocola]|uniref:LytR/AlgR family response regulator transcription factor n=1 Tax=Algoriphagus halophytocola TaxID=2991499 RepID=UPI0022DD8ECA|nr:LytTR family DNA-binding domain-containing protein [Algoriphagus sp. TR-M9]WBL41730.1 LytTR family DNA-binding domain-containing protein [Algoriphagus sp. TR-M9]